MNNDCQECGMLVPDVQSFHPHLFCMLRKAGILDPRAYLIAAGWSYTPERSVIPLTVREATASDGQPSAGEGSGPDSPHVPGGAHVDDAEQSDIDFLRDHECPGGCDFVSVLSDDDATALVASNPMLCPICEGELEQSEEAFRDLVAFVDVSTSDTPASALDVAIPEEEV